MVAEIEEDGVPVLIGVARLESSGDGEWAEYAVLVGDPWQGRGLAELLTTACLAIAQTTGLQRVVAETTADNTGMLAILKHHGFKLEHLGQGEVEGTLLLGGGA
jgi:acetyltransferase